MTPNPPHTHAPPADGSGKMFDGIAPRYDLLNRLMSLGTDGSWRRKAIDLCALEGDHRLLDIATGTADVAILAARRRAGLQVVGLDASAGMLGIGLEKIRRARLTDRVHLTQGDAQALPFPDNSFDAALIAFGIRNVPDRERGIREMVRVVRSGGRIVVLELGMPSGSALAPIARVWVREVVPLLGAAFSHPSQYRYLRESVMHFPDPDSFVALMEFNGVSRADAHPLTAGAAHVYVGFAP